MQKNFVLLLIGVLCGGAAGYYMAKKQCESYWDEDSDFDDDDYFEDEEIADEFDEDEEEPKDAYEKEVSKV